MDYLSNSSSSKDNTPLQEGVSPQTDNLAATLFGDTLDLLAAGDPFGVLLVVEDEKGVSAAWDFNDDGEQEMLDAARLRVKELVASKGDKSSGLAEPVRYALTYLAAVEAADGSFCDALLMEFGEKGYKSYSAYSYVKGRGKNDKFCWSEPAPAGEIDALF